MVTYLYLHYSVNDLYTISYSGRKAAKKRELANECGDGVDTVTTSGLAGMLRLCCLMAK